ncbi:hypothetical protein A2U01_0051522, partial [Trifolium medium]|nr:hypothetical protein [Trifolium medium]
VHKVNGYHCLVMVEVKGHLDYDEIECVVVYCLVDCEMEKMNDGWDDWLTTYLSHHKE